MTVFKTIVSVSALLVAGVGLGGVANAQTAKTMLAAKPAAASAWQCQAKVVEIAPVSQDTNGKATTWVMVHRVGSEVIAAERLNNTEVEQIRRLPCQGERLEAPPPLVG
ncbi:MAG: hypothetical protein EON93_10200 [Burkholderiales bacterium]|nr:MAG: hypothetical protein EON93_10200 [Burkholderiales bacterium]